MQGMEDRVRLACVRVRHKIASIYIIFIPHAFQENGVQIFIQIFFQPAVVIRIDPAKADPHITVAHHVMEIHFQRPERLQHIQLLRQLIHMLFQPFLPLHQFQILMVQIPDHTDHGVLIHGKVRLHRRIRQKRHKFFRFIQRFSIWIHFHKRKQIFRRFQLGDSIFQLHLVPGEIDLANPVNIAPWTADAQEFHFYDHCFTPPMYASVSLLGRP